jgi:hypothetical protein
VAFDGKFLIGLDFFPAEVTRFSKCAHFFGSRGESPDARDGSACRRIRQTSATDRLELGQIDVILAEDEALTEIAKRYQSTGRSRLTMQKCLLRAELF